MDTRTGEKVLFGDELHSRLRFNRRGLVGMAKMGESTYGSQFFITLADVRSQLDGKCTLFGRVEGDGIYNVVRIAEAENVEATDRPVYPFKITGAEVLEMPRGEPWASMRKRERVAKRTAPQDEEMEGKVKKKAKTKRDKALLSFGDEAGGDDDTALRIQSKPKFNTSLIHGPTDTEDLAPNGQPETGSDKVRTRPADISARKQTQESHRERAPREKTALRRRSSPNSPPKGSIATPRSPQTHRRKPSFHDPITQLPLKDPESPSRSPSRSGTDSPKLPLKPSTSAINAEIAALKASMRRTVPSAPEQPRKKSALQQLIPETSIRGRKRPRPGDGAIGTGANNDSSALRMLNAFRARLEGADRGQTAGQGRTNGINGVSRRQQQQPGKTVKEKDPPADDEKEEGEEATLCDLHFIVNCQSCSKWDHQHRSNPSNANDLDHPNNSDQDDDAEGTAWISHALSFEKDRLGKDLTWKKKNEEELVVIDPREKERDIRGNSKRGGGIRMDREWGGRGS